MARILNIGFELNSITNGIEFASTSGSPTIVTNPVRTGTYAGRISSLSSGTPMYFRTTSLGTGPVFLRFYFRVATLPSAANQILNMVEAFLSIDNTGALQLSDEDGNIGSASSPLSVNTWYRIEIEYNVSGGGGSHIVRARIDGVEFAGSNTRNIFGGTITSVSFGGNLSSEAQTTGDWFFDDIAVNNTSGSFQASYPGAARLLRLKPNGTGDNGDWSSDYTAIDEVTPDETTTVIGSGTADQIEDVNIESASGAIGVSDTINFLAVGLRARTSSGTDPDPTFVARIKATSGGTVEESATITPPGTTFFTNSPTGVPTEPLILYDLPGASTTAWTRADIEDVQIGVRETLTESTVQVTALWLLVDYTPLIEYKNILASSDSDGDDESTTASFTPLADTLYAVSVSSRTGISADPNEPTVTGADITWSVAESIVYDDSSSSRRRITVFTGSDASPSAGALTIDFGGQNQTNVVFSIDEFYVDGDTASVIQSDENADTSGTVSTLTVTLGAFGDADNGAFGAFANGDSTRTVTAGSGFFGLGNVADGGSTMRLFSEWNPNNDTSVDTTWSDVSELGGIALEIAASAAAPPGGGGAISGGKLALMGVG